MEVSLISRLDSFSASRHLKSSTEQHLQRNILNALPRRLNWPAILCDFMAALVGCGAIKGCT